MVAHLQKSYTIIAGTFTSFINTYSFNDPGCFGTPSISLVGQSAYAQAGWVELHPNNASILFSAIHTEPGYVASYLIDSNGLLKQFSNTSSSGNDPPHLLVMQTGREVVVPNYGSGNVQSHYLAEDELTFIGSSNVVTLQGSGPNPTRQGAPHPHQAVKYENEVLVPDLGSDKVWRLTKSGTNWLISGFIQQPFGTGPRHIVPFGDNLYTLHELSSTLTAQTIPPLGSSTPPQLLANLSTLPTDIPANSTYGAAELELTPVSESFPKRYLLASNRNVSPSPSAIDPRGDTIGIFEVEPDLRLVKQVYTGLQQIRGMKIGGDKGQYVIAAGLTGGGVAVFERVEGGTNLKLLARYTTPGSSESVVSFVWL
ncbi:Lactonase, 7-bladed beta-propeller-domain-containing protein [Cantharellus anzutake]|uniref:Lactonase, 7-bladed beta-propeller-domain-containing protein n=1 Tax=Cantharellus anzutake TaxID=1750568 RepID=UPI001902F87E|nr:Lactonase, 7-bladed beta-propeller-domain-containing protein [Cantharellus anzutake]KAF8325283.1 Lactonase, 7-bladed beta-propeller-domain-containing protein [Cantharellus anzutake]